jgi:hypothetical protein
MVLPLPGALANFSASALKNISSLDAITKSIPNPQSAVRDNVTKSVTGSVTSAPTDVFNGAPSVVSGESERFLGAVSAPPQLSTTLQRQALGGVFGSSLPSGPGIDTFLAQNVKLGDVLPSQQIFSIAKNLGAQSMYTDPLQAYAQVTESAHDISNLCREVSSITATLISNIASLLSLQSTLDYNQITAMNREFFGKTGEQTNAAIAALNVVNSTFGTRGRFDSAEVANLCAALDGLTNLVMFSNSKVIQFELLRKSIDEGLNRFNQIVKELVLILESTIAYIPAYAASVVTGKLFQAVQSKVLEQSGIDLGRILKDAEAFSSLNADDKSKVLLTSAIGASAQVIKAYLCVIQPATEVLGGEPVITTLKGGYDSMTSVLSASPLNSYLDSFEAALAPFQSTMNTGVTRNNSSELAASSSTMTTILTASSVAFVAICAATDAYSLLFATETALDPSRVVGANQLFSDVGADASRDALMSSDMGAFTTQSLSEATTPGQLAISLRNKIAETPEGPQRDALILAYEDVQARHRATVLGMDIQRREDVRTFLAPVNAEEDRQIVNKTVEQFSGEDFTEVRTFL